MQPEFSPHNRGGGEMQPPAPGYSYEVPPNFASQEMAPGQSFEIPMDSPERAQERSPIELAPPPPPMPTMPVQAVAVPMPEQPQSAVAGSSSPNTADDDDVIEKEWVDRAKQIIAQTREDPSAREKALGALQKDYLFKRYGKQLGVTNEQ